MNKAVLALSLFATLPAFANSTSYGDKYGDVMVASCGDGTYVEMVDPNRCGEAMATGSMGCTELAVFFQRVKPASVSDKSVVLQKNENREHVLTIEGAKATYTQSWKGRVIKTYTLNETTIDKEKLDYSCQMPVEN